VEIEPELSGKTAADVTGAELSETEQRAVAETEDTDCTARSSRPPASKSQTKRTAKKKTAKKTSCETQAKITVSDYMYV